MEQKAISSTHTITNLFSGHLRKRMTKKASFDLSYLYHPNKNRVYLYIILWSIFTILCMLNVIFLYATPIITSFIFALRNLADAMIFFYFIFYFIVPQFLKKNRIILFIIGLFIPFWLCSIANYSFMILLSKHFSIPDKNLMTSVKAIANKSFIEIISPKAVFQTSIGILMLVSPPLSIKLIAEMSRSSTRAIRLERDNLNLEVSFLRSQLNPHFLFNTLNNIYSLSVRNHPHAPELELQLSNMMRFTLYESNMEKVDLSKEFEFLSNYVELERVRYDKNMDIQFCCDLESAEGYQIAPLLTFPFIENAFKHGLDTSEKDAWLKISMAVINHVLVFDISNSKGEDSLFKQGDKAKSGGIGIANTQKRLSILYRDKYSLSIKNNPDSYHINLKLTLI